MAQPPAELLSFLRDHEVDYRLIHHPVVYTAQELAAVLGIKGRQFAKVVVLAEGAALKLAVLSADCRIDFTRLPGHRLASEPEITKVFVPYAVGAIPPFGELFGVPTLLDELFPTKEPIAFEAGTHADAIKINGADFLKLARPQLASFADKVT